MRIDESCINHNAEQLVKDAVDELYDLTEADGGIDHMRIAILGEIRGICAMAERMKEVLEA